MGVDVRDKHTLKHIYGVCGSQPVRLMIVKRVFQWLGHVCRMPNSRLPKMALTVRYRVAEVLADPRLLSAIRMLG